MNTNQIARIASLVGEPARAAMLLQLMDGRMLTATELARAGNVSAQTASRHLAQMVVSGLMCVEQRGRHRYHRLASGEVAKVLEGLMRIAGNPPVHHKVVVGPRNDAMRMARMCYDHIAGRLGLAITESLLVAQAIEFDGDGGQITGRAPQVLQQWGLTLEPELHHSRQVRPYCRPCLDWSERKAHLAGRLGAVICTHCLEMGWLNRTAGTRALGISPSGARTFRERLGLDAWRRVTDAA
ncbi:MAG: helix-turn-helix transcriptional regulator [Comamonadaceae bacterium]|nr:helix-turn-helix transcriptional regulator [Comamonadaceae bacterium]